MADNYGSNLMFPQILSNPEIPNLPGIPAGAPGSDAALSNASPAPGFLSNPANVMGLISMMGQAGAAISPDDTIGRRLGGVAANMGSQKLQQMASQEAEKRTMQFYKDLFANKTPVEIEAIKKELASPIGGVGNPISTPGSNLASLSPATSGSVAKSFADPLTGVDPTKPIRTPQLDNGMSSGVFKTGGY